MTFNFFPKLAVLALIAFQSAVFAFFPFTETLNFNEETNIYSTGFDYRAFDYEFTLDNPTVLTFSSNDERIRFDLFKNAELTMTGGSVNSSGVLVLEAGTYYLYILDSWQGTDDFSVNVEINAKEIPQEKDFYIVEDISLPFSAGLYFHPDFNSRIAGDGYIEKVFKINLDEAANITYVKGSGSPINIYKDDLTQFVEEIKLTSNMGMMGIPMPKTFPLQEGVYYFAFNDNYVYEDNKEKEEKYAGVFVELDIEYLSAVKSVRAPQIAPNGIKAYTLGHSIILQNVPKNTKTQVYNLSGELIYSSQLSTPNSQPRIEVRAKGIYLVKAGGQILRVVVK